MHAKVLSSAVVALTLTLVCLAFGAQGASADSSFSAPNDTGGAVSGIIVYLSGQAQAKVDQTTAPGCGTPHIGYLPGGLATGINFGDPTPTPVPTPVGGTFYDSFIAVWPTACLAPGASVTFEFDAACSCLSPEFSAHEWLPSPVVAGQTVFRPHNDTGNHASELKVGLLVGCIDFKDGINCGPDTTFAPPIVSIDRNPLGCPEPQVTAASVAQEI